MNLFQTENYQKLDWTEGVFVNGKSATVYWFNKVWLVQTDHNPDIELYESIPESIVVNYLNILGFRVTRRMAILTLIEGNSLKIQLDVTCNCHGFSVLKGKGWLNFPDTILETEYMNPVTQNSIETDVEYVVTWLDGNSYVHSGIYLNGVVTHKKNIQLIKPEPLQKVNLTYGHCQMFFWKKLKPEKSE